MTNLRKLLVPILWLLCLTQTQAETFHVTMTGQDQSDRDGKSVRTAWASLAYACEQVPEGQHTIQLGPGLFTATRRAQPKTGFSIVGSGSSGDKATRIVASKEFLRPQVLTEDADGREKDEYLIAVRWAENLELRHLELSSPVDHLVRGGFFCRDVKGLKIEDVVFRDFRWNGARLEFSEACEVSRCVFQDTSRERTEGMEGGLFRTRWVSKCRFHHNKIIAKETMGYGYKAGGHVDVRFDHNFVDTGYFAVESAHESEYGLEIDHNHLTRCISVPKPGPAEDPNNRGFPFGVWIHDNLLNDSYTVEGPRNHLWLTHNHIDIKHTGGRVYTQHGGVTHGPITIAHNIVENVDRSLVWMNEGLLQNVTVINNTVLCADAADRADFLFASYTAERLDNWVIKNNIFIAPESQPRYLFPLDRGVPDKITALNNLTINIKNVPQGNFDGQSPGFKSNGKRPSPWFTPANDQSFIVGKGIDAGWPGSGKTTQLGAYEMPEIDSDQRRPFPTPTDVQR